MVLCRWKMYCTVQYMRAYVCSESDTVVVQTLIC